MKALLALLLGITICFGFKTSESSVRSISPLAGKWMLVGTDINGVCDTTKSETKVMYYEFGTDNSFEMSYIRNTDTTTYRIGGRFKSGKNMTRLTIFNNDKDKTKSVYEIQELNYTSMKLVSVRKEDGKKTTFVSHFQRVQ